MTSRSSDLKPLVIIVIVFAALFAYIFVQVESERLGRRNGRLKQDLEQVRDENDRLHADFNALSSPTRLAELAKEMNLAAPSQSQIVELGKDKK